MPSLTPWVRLDCGDECPFIKECIDRYEQHKEILGEMETGDRPSINAYDVWAEAQADAMQANVAAHTCETGPILERKYKIIGKKVLKCGGTKAEGIFVPSASSL